VPKRQKPSFLANVDLGPDPEERVGRRKKAKQRREQKEQAKQQRQRNKRENIEMEAEQRPRAQKSWTEDARKATKLPIVGGGDGESAAREAHAASAEGVLGKRKADEWPFLRKKSRSKRERKRRPCGQKLRRQRRV